MLINQESDIRGMLNGVPLKEIASVITAVGVLVNIGIVFTSFGHVVNNTVRKLNPWLGFEPIYPEEPELFFDRIFAILLNPLGAKIGAYTRSPRTTKLALQLSLGVVVVISAVTVEILGLFTVTGVAFAKHHLTGASFDLTAAYQNVVAVVVFLTLVFMSYGTRKINKQTRNT